MEAPQKFVEDCFRVHMLFLVEGKRRHCRSSRKSTIIDVSSLDRNCYGTWRLDVCYKGHSNKRKTILASTYSVRYAGIATVTGNNISFPPYDVSRSRITDLNASKISFAVDGDGNDVTALAKCFSRPKNNNFHADLQSSEKVIRYFMPVPVVIASLSSGEKLFLRDDEC